MISIGDVGQPLCVGHLGRPLERAVDEQRAQIGEVPRALLTELFLLPRQFGHSRPLTWFVRRASQQDGSRTLSGGSLSLIAVTVHELSRTRRAPHRGPRPAARPSARPTDLLESVRHLTLLQNDQTAAVAPSADLVVWSRLGSSYSPADLRTPLRRAAVADRAARHAPARPRTSRSTAPRWPSGRAPASCATGRKASATGCAANDACRRDILDRLRADGPLPRARAARHLRESRGGRRGWNNNRNVAHDARAAWCQRGEVAVAGREGRDRLWDLAERVYPDDAVVPAEEALRIRNERRLRALGIARRPGTGVPGRAERRRRGRRARGRRGRERAVAGRPALPRPAVRGRAALLSPLDRLVYRPQADGRDLRVRLPARDVQAGGEAPVGLLRAADPVRRPAGRQARRHRRPQGRACCGSTRSTRTCRSPRR